MLPEPGLYRRAQLAISDPEGNQYIAQRCPVALEAEGRGPCHIVRRGFLTKHGVIGAGFPVALSHVQKLACQTHKRHFNMLHPLVHQSIPPGCVVQPELVVLTDNLVFLREAHVELALQVCTNLMNSAQ